MHKHRTVQILGIVIIAASLVYLVLGVIGAISLGGSGLGEGWSSGWRGWLTIPIFLTTCLGFVALLVFGALLYFLAKIDANLAEAQQRIAAAAAKLAVVSAPVAVAVGAVAAERHDDEIAVDVAAPTVAVVAAAERPEEKAEVEVAAPVIEAPAVEVEAPAAAAVAATVIAAEQPEEAVEIGAPATAPAAAAPVVDDTEALRAQIAALQAQLGALDAATAPAPARLPGTDEAARIAAEMAALKPPKS